MIKDILGNEGYIDGIFMIKQATEAVSNSGSHYLALTLQDVSGTIDAKKWSIDPGDLEIAIAGSLIRVQGMSSMYRGHPQLKINELDAVDESQVDLSKYIPVAPVPMDEMKKTLNDYIEMIQDKELHDLTKQVLTDHYNAYTTYPAAVTVHHAYVGGLLFHSLSICSQAIKVQEQYTYLSLDYLIAGSLLHDIGKTKELSAAKAPSYTSEGNLLGHISIGAMIVYEAGIKMNIDKEKLDVLVHMILAHHGEYEFGSPKLPATAEAYVLHSLDDLDAKLECLRLAYDKTLEGDFTGKIVWMENSNFYKPKKLN
ncbi:MAG: HD domain-containing protein [Bacilli bacterium]|nr:HD domain-containing protein [Bacilli bacterium]